MTKLVELRRDGAIAVIMVDNPPVNALKHAVRQELMQALTEARDDPGVDALVLGCAGRTFIAGADISEFDQIPRQPSLIDLITTLDAITKPTIAAMHGTALGGGLELTLACHFRLVAQGTRLGLPEIKLGLIPGAGGTQRLPRLIGIERALPMILSGEPIGAQEALQIGLVDGIVEGDLSAAAVEFARAVVAEKRPMRRVRDMEDRLAPMRADPSAFAEFAGGLTKRPRGLQAPLAAIEAVRWTLDMPIDQALARERAKFMELREGEQSKAQRHIFFAEREAAKVSDIAGIRPREVVRAAVIGAGTMGGGIAMCFAGAGIPVTIVESSAEALTRGRDTIAKNYRHSLARGALAPDEMERRLERIRGATDLEAVGDADIVIEAVFEEMDVKQRVFGGLDRLTKPDAVLATNTSYLDVNAIAHATQRPESVVGMHFFSPANVMRLLEVVRGTATAPDVLATAISVGRRLGKVPAVVGVCHGFVGNRMLRARSIEAERILLEGALPDEVDAAIVEFGFPMGPFAMGDLAGLDVSWRMRKSRGQRAIIADALCDLGRFGQKTGQGFYLYREGSRNPLPDPHVEHLIVEASKGLGIVRRRIDKAEVIERLIYPMINEGARILEEGIAQRSGDIDVIWVYGYGWPAWRGGPMHHADRLGLARIRDRLTALAQQSDDARLRPADLLEQLVASGGSFGSWASSSRRS